MKKQPQTKPQRNTHRLPRHPVQSPTKISRMTKQSKRRMSQQKRAPTKGAATIERDPIPKSPKRRSQNSQQQPERWRCRGKSIVPRCRICTLTHRSYQTKWQVWSPFSASMVALYSKKPRSYRPGTTSYNSTKQSMPQNSNATSNSTAYPKS